jgi:hypothetical protein
LFRGDKPGTIVLENHADQKYELKDNAWPGSSNESSITYEEDTLDKNWAARYLTGGGQGWINFIKHKTSHQLYILKLFKNAKDDESLDEIAMLQAAKGSPRIL